MENETLDYQSPGLPRQSVANSATAILGAVVLLVNAGLLFAAASDRSWGALQIAVAIGPIANLAMMVIARLSMLLVKRLSCGANLLPYGLVSLLLPLLAIPTDFLIIGSMGLHGC